MQRELVVLLDEYLPYIATEPRQHYKPVLDIFYLVGSARDKSRHAESFQLVILFERLNIFVLSIALIEMHLNKQRAILAWFLEN